MFKRIVITLVLFVSFGSLAAQDIAKLISEAENGNGVASFKVARAYYSGNGVEQDHQKAMDWYQVSANQNEPSAQVGLGLKYAIGEETEKNMKLAYVWFKLAEKNAHQVGKRYREKAEKELSTEELKSANEIYKELEIKIFNK